MEKQRMRDYSFWSTQDFNKLVQECSKYTERKQRISWSNVQKLFPGKTKDQIKSQYFNFKNNIKIQGKISKYKRIANQISQDSVSLSTSDNTSSVQNVYQEEKMSHSNSVSYQLSDQEFDDFINSMITLDLTIL